MATYLLPMVGGWQSYLALISFVKMKREIEREGIFHTLFEDLHRVEGSDANSFYAKFNTSGNDHRNMKKVFQTCSEN